MREREKKAEKSPAHTRKRGATGKREESANAMRHGELLILPDECMFKGLPARVIDGLSWNRSDTISAACGVITRKYRRPCTLAFTTVSRQFFSEALPWHRGFYRHRKTYTRAFKRGDMPRLIKENDVRLRCTHITFKNFYSAVMILHDRWLQISLYAFVNYWFLVEISDRFLSEISVQNVSRF